MQWGHQEEEKKSQNRRMAWVGRNLKCYLLPTSLLVMVANHQIRLLRIPYYLILNASMDAASTTSLGYLFQHLTTL